MAQRTEKLVLDAIGFLGSHAQRAFVCQLIGQASRLAVAAHGWNLADRTENQARETARGSRRAAFFLSLRNEYEAMLRGVVRQLAENVTFDHASGGAEPPLSRSTRYPGG